MIEEEYREIVKVSTNFAVAWTGNVWRILERVTDDGKFITWPIAFVERDNAVTFLVDFLDRQARRCRESA